MNDDSSQARDAARKQWEDEHVPLVTFRSQEAIERIWNAAWAARGARAKIDEGYEEAWNDRNLAEVDRLRAENERLQERVALWESATGWKENIDRLRGLLREVVPSDPRAPLRPISKDLYERVRKELGDD